MGLNYLFDDRQSNTCAAVLARPGLLAAIKTFEDQRKLINCNLLTAIDEDHFDAFRQFFCKDSDSAAARCVLERIL